MDVDLARKEIAACAEAGLWFGEAMTYEEWRQEVFGNASGSDPVTLELSEQTYALPKDRALNYIDQCLVDPAIHKLFTKEQIGVGLQIIYNNACSHLPFCYLQAGDEKRRCEAISNLRHLYTNFFEAYCAAPVSRVGYDLDDGPMGSLCYMFWDTFVLYPGNASPPMIDAAVEVMKLGLNSKNDNCVVSAIHGLGHWAAAAPAAVQALESWLQHPSTENTSVYNYARQAKSGCIQ